MTTAEKKQAKKETQKKQTELETKLRARIRESVGRMSKDKAERKDLKELISCIKKKTPSEDLDGIASTIFEMLLYPLGFEAKE